MMARAVYIFLVHGLISSSEVYFYFIFALT